jgi:hypothetical protein
LTNLHDLPFAPSVSLQDVPRQDVGDVLAQKLEDDEDDDEEHSDLDDRIQSAFSCSPRFASPTPSQRSSAAHTMAAWKSTRRPHLSSKTRTCRTRAHPPRLTARSATSRGARSRTALGTTGTAEFAQSANFSGARSFGIRCRGTRGIRLWRTGGVVRAPC